MRSQHSPVTAEMLTNWVGKMLMLKADRLHLDLQNGEETKLGRSPKVLKSVLFVIKNGHCETARQNVALASQNGEKTRLGVQMCSNETIL